MKNEFVPYDTALALKGLGFDEPCFAGYSEDENGSRLCLMNILSDGLLINAEDEDCECLAPTYSQAFRWFRDKYNMYCPIMPADLGKYEEGNPDFQAGIYTREPVDVESLNTFKTYEEAELACLKKLIEIINQNKDDKAPEN